MSKGFLWFAQNNDTKIAENFITIDKIINSSKLLLFNNNEIDGIFNEIV